MKTRDVTIFSGHRFAVPQGIQRIDSRSTHGWQVRYHGTKFFSDGMPADGSNAARSLEKATRELLGRIAAMPAPVTLKRGPSANKSSRLPPGISGPIVARRGDSEAQWAVISVLVPRFGRKPQVKRIYIGTPKTYTQAKYRQALARAIAIRTEAQEAYETAATRARRREATELRKSLAAARRAAAAA